jgi:hypothetical protein
MHRAHVRGHSGFFPGIADGAARSEIKERLGRGAELL